MLYPNYVQTYKLLDFRMKYILMQDFYTCLEKYLKAYAQLFALPLNIHWRLIKVLEQTTASLSHITSSRGYLSYENK